MLFLAFSKVDANFIKWKLTLRSYILANALPTTKQIKIFDQEKFMTADLNLKKDVFIVYIAFFSIVITIYPTQEAQIVLLIAKKVIDLTQYLDFAIVCSKTLVVQLPKCSDINKHAINLEPSKETPFKLFYILRPIKSKTLKIYIEIKLANRYIRSFKFFAPAAILFVSLLNSSFRMCIDYCIFTIS